LINDDAQAKPLEGRGLELAYGNLAKGCGLAEAVAGVHTVINLAVCWRARGVETYEAVNHQGVQRLMEAARAAGVKRVVHLSERWEADDPKYPYLRSRYGGRLAVMQNGIPYTIVQPGIVFGSGDYLTETVASHFRHRSVMPVGARRDLMLQPIHVDDLVRCIIAVTEDPRFENQALDLGGPEHLTFQEVVDAIKQRLDRRGPFPPLSVKAARAVAVFSKLLRIRRGQPLASFEIMAHATTTPNLDVVPRLFGFQPRRLADSIDYLVQDPANAAS
jgi:NADH dehydrogenase